MSKNKIRKKRNASPATKQPSKEDLKQGKRNLYLLGVMVVVSVVLIFYGLGLNS